MTASPLISSGRARRRFLLQGAALLGGAALSSTSVAKHAQRAGGAGTLRIGGEWTVNRMGYGAMRLTGEGIWGEPTDAREARAVLRRAVELGVNFIDTADSYGPAVSERLIAEALHPYDRGLLIATKGGLLRPGPNKWVPDGRPEHLREACESSLRRLKVERIDLYQLHVPDPKVPYADSVGALARLQQEGKIRFIGVSNVSLEQLALARSIAQVVSVQNRYNVADRSSDPVLAECERAKLAFIPWFPLAQRAQAAETPDARITTLQAIGKAHGLNTSQAAIAWLLGRSPVMLPIPGTSKVEHLEQNVAAAQVRFSARELAQLA